MGDPPDRSRSDRCVRRRDRAGSRPCRSVYSRRMATETTPPPLADRAAARRARPGRARPRRSRRPGIRRFFDILATMDDVISLGRRRAGLRHPAGHRRGRRRQPARAAGPTTRATTGRSSCAGRSPPTSSGATGSRYDPATRDPHHRRRVRGRRPRPAGDLRPRRRGDPARAVVRRLRARDHLRRRRRRSTSRPGSRTTSRSIPAAVEAAITPRTKALFLGYPCNPTGAVLPDAIQDELARIAVRHDLLVYSDEIYDRLAYGSYRHRAFSALPGMRDRTILMGGFSKAYAMTGWRVG